MVNEDITIAIKWRKQEYTTTIQPTSSGHSLKLQIQTLTGVPVHRQKLLCKSVWKGALKDDDTIPNGKSSLTITLIGNADVLVENPIEERPLFSEDLTSEELWKATRPQHIDTQEEDIVDIIALQKEVGFERYDGKAGMYQYNRLVTGLPQHQINDMLVCRKKQSDTNNNNGEDDTAANNKTDELTGEVAMTMGMELRKGYVNSLAVLQNGTIVSGLDDGHVQLWRRGELVKDLKHPSTKVEHVLVCPSSSTNHNAPSFVTAGDGCICMWSEDGQQLSRFGSYPGTSPSSIAIRRISNGRGGYIIYLACSSKITRKIDPNQFRLVPQNEAERQRRRAAEAQERMIQNELNSVSKKVRVFFYDDDNQSNSTAVRQDVITPDSLEDSAPITNLLDMNGCLVCGDANGGIRIHEWLPHQSNSNTLTRRQIAHMQFRGSSIACLAMVQENHLAVSIQPRGDDTSIVSSATPLQTTRPRGIYILDTKLKQATVKAVLDAHKDTVHCICPLPNGDLISAGGRMDATCRLWNSKDISNAIQATADESNEEEVNVLTDAPVWSLDMSLIYRFYPIRMVQMYTELLRLDIM